MQFNFFLRPVVTEKATFIQKEGKYQFFVRKEATKIAVRNAFEKCYGVKVSKVNVIRTASKTRMGRSRVPVMKKKELKKVIITTKGKKTLDIMKPRLR